MDLQKSYDAPLEYLASLMVAFSSVVMLGKYEILVRKSSNWVEHPIIWMSVIGDPYQKKTPCMKIYKHLIDEYQLDLDREFNEQLKTYKSQKNKYNMNLKRAKSEAMQNVIEFFEPEKPKKLILSTQNTTVEALCKTLASNNTYGRLVSIVVDELTEFLKSLGQYKSGGNSDNDFLLQAWSYQNYYSIQRVTTENIAISLGFSIIGTIQLKPLLNLMFPEGINSSNGYCQRWLYVTTDYDKIGLSEEDDGLTPDVSAIKQIFDKLYNVSEKRQYTFSKEANKYFIQTHNEILKEAKKSKSALNKAYLEKLSSYIARFALIIHCWYDSNNLEISLKDVKRAVLLSKYFCRTYKYVIRQLSHVDSLVDQVWEYIQVNNYKEITPTALTKANKSKFRDSKLLLEKLANKGYGRLVKAKNGGNFYLLSCKNLKNGHIVISEQDRKINFETMQKLRLRTETSCLQCFKGTDIVNNYF